MVREEDIYKEGEEERERYVRYMYIIERFHTVAENRGRSLSYGWG